VHVDRLDIDLSLDGLMELILELLSDKPDLVAYRQLYASASSHGLRGREADRVTEKI